jgi:hypothetical protein
VASLYALPQRDGGIREPSFEHFVPPLLAKDGQTLCKQPIVICENDHKDSATNAEHSDL